MIQTKSAHEVLQDKLLLYGFEIEILAVDREDWGKWDCNDGVTLVVAKSGTSLVKTGYFDDPEILEVIEKFCPKGRGDFATLLAIPQS